MTDEAVRREYLEKIVQRSQYITDMMSRQFSAETVLDSSRLSCTRMDLLQLVRRAAEDMQAAAAEQGVTIQVVSGGDQLPMVADAYLLNRVLFNLLENSLKYMGRAGVVTILVRQQGEQAVLQVRDDGMGLSAAETAHIFELRYQGSNRAGGSGHGLYLVRQTVEAHGGTVSAESDLGRGMRITLQFPLQPALTKEDATVSGGV